MNATIHSQHPSSGPPARLILERALAAALVLAGLAGLSSCRSWRDTSDNPISVSGNIELTEVHLSFKIPGRIVALNAEEGSAVSEGAELGRLDSEQLVHQLQREQAGLKAAESLLRQLETSIQHQRATVAAETELRRADLRHAEARLRDLQAGARPQEIQQAQAALAEALSQRIQAEKEWERAQVLYRNDDISTSQYDLSRAHFDRWTAALAQARERASLVREGPRKEEIEAARAQVGGAGAALKLAEAAHLEIRRRELEQETRRAEIERARAQVALLDSQLRDAVVVSPISGIVLVKSSEAGEIVAAGTPFITIGDMERPWLRAYINEKDIGRVKLGSRARVTTDSHPDKIYWGKVSFISSEAEFTPKQIQTPEERVKLVYRIKIDIENPKLELKLNMPADAAILLDEK